MLSFCSNDHYALLTHFKNEIQISEKKCTCYFQPSSPLNGERSPHENGPDKKKDGPSSPRSDGSSHASTPSSKNKDVSVTKPIFGQGFKLKYLDKNKWKQFFNNRY